MRSVLWRVGHCVEAPHYRLPNALYGCTRISRRTLSVDAYKAKHPKPARYPRLGRQHNAPNWPVHVPEYKVQDGVSTTIRPEPPQRQRPDDVSVKGHSARTATHEQLNEENDVDEDLEDSPEELEAAEKEQMALLEEKVEELPVKRLRKTSLKNIPALALANYPLLEGYDYETELPLALATHNGDQVIRCMHAACNADDQSWIRGLSNEVFSHILRVLEPQHSVVKVLQIYQETRQLWTTALGLTPPFLITGQYCTVLNQVVLMRQISGGELQVEDWRTLLKAFKDLDRPMYAASIWRQMLNCGHMPDLESYNHYLSAIANAGFRHLHAQHRRRIVSTNIEARAAKKSSRVLAHYLVDLENKLGTNIQAHVSQIFNDMVARGVLPSEETFCWLILAAGKNGDMDAVKALTLKAWGIDIDAVLDPHGNTPLPPEHFSPASQLQPTPRLLTVIADAFGMNNRVPEAFHLVEYIAQQYDLLVSDEVWKLLLEWTFVMTIKRKKSGDPSLRAGQMDASSLTHVWNMMTNEPHCIEPTPLMKRFYVKNMYNQEALPKMLSFLPTLHQYYKQVCNDSRMAMARLRKALSASRNNGSGSEDAKPITFFRDDWDVAEAKRQIEFIQCRHVIEMVLGRMRRYVTHTDDHGVSTVALPKLLWNFMRFVPEIIHYETRTGLVEMRLKPQASPRIDLNRHLRILEGDKLRAAARKYAGHVWLLNKQSFVTKAPWYARKMRRRRWYDFQFKRIITGELDRRHHRSRLRTPHQIRRRMRSLQPANDQAE